MHVCTSDGTAETRKKMKNYYHIYPEVPMLPRVGNIGSDHQPRRCASRCHQPSDPAAQRPSWRGGSGPASVHGLHQSPIRAPILRSHRVSFVTRDIRMRQPHEHHEHQTSNRSAVGPNHNPPTGRSTFIPTRPRGTRDIDGLSLWAMSATR